MRITQPARIASSSLSLFIQYSLVISIAVLPFSTRPTVRGQQRDAAAERAKKLEPQKAADESGATAVEQVKRLTESGPFGEKTGVPGAKSLVEEVMGFAGPKTPNDVWKLLANKADGEPQQDPVRPTLTPPTPGIASGGTGPDGGFFRGKTGTSTVRGLIKNGDATIIYVTARSFMLVERFTKGSTFQVAMVRSPTNRSQEPSLK